MEGGAEALHLNVDRLLDAEALDLLLKGVYLDYIRLHIVGAGVGHGPAAWGAALADLARMRDLSPEALRGGIAWDPAAVRPDWAYAADYLAFMGETLPGCYAFGLRESSEGLYAGRAAALLARAHALATHLEERGASAEAAIERLCLTPLVGSAYFAEIGRLRALRLLWSHWRKYMGMSEGAPLMCAYFAPQAYGDEPFQNLIKTAIIAMSAFWAASMACVRAHTTKGCRAATRLRWAGVWRETRSTCFAWSRVLKIWKTPCAALIFLKS